jgi:hypothetical protein
MFGGRDGERRRVGLCDPNHSRRGFQVFGLATSGRESHLHRRQYKRFRGTPCKFDPELVFKYRRWGYCAQLGQRDVRYVKPYIRGRVRQRCDWSLGYKSIQSDPGNWLTDPDHYQGNIDIRFFRSSDQQRKPAWRCLHQLRRSLQLIDSAILCHESLKHSWR